MRYISPIDSGECPVRVEAVRAGTEVLVPYHHRIP